MRTTRTPRQKLAGVAALALLATPLAACATEDSTGQTSSGETQQSQEAQQAPPEPVAEIVGLTGNSTAINLDQGFLDALNQLQLTPGTVGEATLQDGRLEFPITGGNLAVYEPGAVSPYVIGQIQHVSSGLSLSAGGTTVQLENLLVDPAFSRVYGDVIANGEVAAEGAYLFTLDGSTLEPLQASGGTAVLEGTRVLISPDAAALLNQTFNTDAVTPELLVGTAEITVDTTGGSDASPSEQSS